MNHQHPSRQFLYELSIVAAWKDCRSRNEGKEWSKGWDERRWVETKVLSSKVGKKGRKRFFSVAHAVFLKYSNKEHKARGLRHGSLFHNTTYSTQTSKSFLLYSTPAVYSTLRTLAPLRFAVFFFLFPLSNATALAWSLPTLSRSLTL